ncbi:hypothetical protein ACHAWF_014070 [Thalassiosira exigua]
MAIAVVETSLTMTMLGSVLVAAVLLMPSACAAFSVPAGFFGLSLSTHLSRWTSRESDPVAFARQRASSFPLELRMGRVDGLFKSSSSPSREKSLERAYDLEVLDEVGSGSYGVVHLSWLVPRNNLDSNGDMPSPKYVITKRAWMLGEFQAEVEEEAAKTDAKEGSEEAGGEARKGTPSDGELRELAGRCNHYLDVERHCLAKLASMDDDQDRHFRVPRFLGVYPYEARDNGGNDWLVFDLVWRDDGGDGTTPARTLVDVLELDWIDQHEQDEADPNAHHHLYLLQKELGMGDSATFADVLDKVLLHLLRTISDVNDANVVHRDVKPGNLLVTPGGLVLIDFGSAADLDPPPSGFGNPVGLDDRVALSPIYAAPETFVRRHKSPTNFDSFSAALVFAQLLFNLLDERADASFRQQLEDVDFDLDAWLQRELNAKLRPDGIEDAIVYLADRPGMWDMLRGTLLAYPEKRLSTSQALRRAEGVLAAAKAGSREGLENEVDGKFFAGVLESFELCDLPDNGAAVGVPMDDYSAAITTTPGQLSAEQALVIPRPLHYVATFSRSQSLGLILSEVDSEGKYDDELSAEDDKLWKEATVDARPGEVYIRGIVEGGQAESIGVFDVGDRVMGVGEFPFIAEGFDAVVEMLGRQPTSAKSVTLHFDRKSIARSRLDEKTPRHPTKVIDQGAWSACGKRKAQEDRLILEEIHGGNNAALLAGVFDGHGGNAASKSLAQLLPSLFSVSLAGMLTDGKDVAASADLRVALESAYDTACRTYREGCDELETCVADYDPREGIVLAAMGAKDVIAGSTATVSVISVSEEGADKLSVLNCGDSRTLVVGKPRKSSSKDSMVHFSTRDHSPSCEVEIERLLLGKDKGYSQAECSMGRWRIKVGDFQYGLARSLEGSFTTSKGIISDPDISVVNLSKMAAEREFACVILASDGLFEVIDNEEAGRVAIKCREEGLEASVAAKHLCLKAIDKGSPDNVSVVVMYLAD